MAGPGFSSVTALSPSPPRVGVPRPAYSTTEGAIDFQCAGISHETTISAPPTTARKTSGAKPAERFLDVIQRSRSGGSAAGSNISTRPARSGLVRGGSERLAHHRNYGIH